MEFKPGKPDFRAQACNHHTILPLKCMMNAKDPKERHKSADTVSELVHTPFVKAV